MEEQTDQLAKNIEISRRIGLIRTMKKTGIRAVKSEPSLEGSLSESLRHVVNKSGDTYDSWICY